MPTFDTPEPISVSLELAVGNARIVASERTDTAVDVRPTNPSDELDVQVAAQTRVAFTNNTVVIKAPRPKKWGWERVGSIDVTVELPAGSAVQASSATGDLVCEGRIGECRLKTAAGHVRLDQTGNLNLTTAAGDITVGHVVGNADITTGSGDLRIRKIDGAARIQNSNGQTWVGEIAGDVRLKAANGGIAIDRALAAVDAKTANGSVRIGEVVRGSIGLATAMGELEIGVREGTAAWLDVRSHLGTVQSSLEATDGPGRSDETVEVRARTGFGDILIHRS